MTMYWSGPMAPLDRATGDRRTFTPGGFAHRPLPLALLWKKATGDGHSGAVVVGRVLHMDSSGDQAYGCGDWFDPGIIPEVTQAMELAKGGVIGVSVDLEPTFTAEVEEVNGQPQVRYTSATMLAATLLPITAFSGMRIQVHDQMPDVLVAAIQGEPGLEESWGQAEFAVNPSGWRGMPIAPRNQPFDADDAINRIVHWAGGDASKLNKVYLWRDPSGVPAAKESYRLPIADIINGQPTLVYHAAYAAAALLSGAHGGLPNVPDADKSKLRTILSEIYKELANAYKDGNLLAPWDRRAKLQKVTSLEPETFASGESGSKVYDYLAKNYPPETLGWVKAASWNQMTVPLSEVDMARRPGGARDQEKVKGIADAITNGKAMEPVVLVRVPGEDKLQIADGYHRTLATQRAGKDGIKAWVGVVDSDSGPWDKEMHEKKLNASLVASGLLRPPAAWFVNPGFTTKRKLRVTEAGQVFGHLAAWDTCHIGIANACVTPPHSNVDYAYFRNGETLTAEGSYLDVGKLTIGTGHAKPNAGVIPAIEHYDHSGLGVAAVNIGEDQFGIWVAGAIAPGTVEEKVAELRRSPLSGDWRRVNGNLELVAALGVNVPGFPIIEVKEGKQVSLLSAGMVIEDDVMEDAVVVDLDAMAREVRDQIKAEGIRAERLSAIVARDQADRGKRLVAFGKE